MNFKRVVLTNANIIYAIVALVIKILFSFSEIEKRFGDIEKMNKIKIRLFMQRSRNKLPNDDLEALNVIRRMFIVLFPIWLIRKAFILE